jgi:hypothetical protein
MRSDDVAHHVAARLLGLATPTRGRDEWFREVKANGTTNALCAKGRAGSRLAFLFSTNRVYGIPETTSTGADHQRVPARKLRSQQARSRASASVLSGPQGRHYDVSAATHCPAGTARDSAEAFRAHPSRAANSHNLRLQELLPDDGPPIAPLPRHAPWSAAALPPARSTSFSLVDPSSIRELPGPFIRRDGLGRWLLPTPAPALKAAPSALNQPLVIDATLPRGGDNRRSGRLSRNRPCRSGLPQDKRLTFLTRPPFE